MDRSRRRPTPVRGFTQAASAFFVLALLLWSTAASRAQTCFIYSDTITAKVPILCVNKGTLLPPCGPPTDCTSVPAGAPQTILAMHTAWHDCFGNTLSDFFGVQPPGRGQRWYAFHRQFENDFNIWRAPFFPKIESHNWCPNMVLTEGHPSAMAGGIPGHPAGCGDGNTRPDNRTCLYCEAFPPCLFFGGAGPNCGPGVTGNDAFCTVGGTTYTALEQFPDVDTVAEVLDGYFHGIMHFAVGQADDDLSDGVSLAYVNDAGDPRCSPRDPMFWRLHKALDDVVRAWQDHTATDIILVLDKSGSMAEADSGGMTKLDAAVQSARMFADILDNNRADGQVNRIGIVTFSSTAALNLPLTDAGPTLLNPGGPLDTALNAISSAGPGGATGIGPGLQRALDELCGGDCNGYTPAPGENSRKAILVLTDGMENVAPCLSTSGDCSGSLFDRTKLGFAQICAVGFGDSGSLDGDVLTLLAEQAGGIYMQNPASGVADDLKKFFVMGYGQLTDEFLLADPHGFLPANQPATEPITYDVCSDSKITFASGWKTPVPSGSLRLIVTSPDGHLVRPGGGVQSSVQDAWDYKRLRLPYRGESAGTWRAHLIRPHRTFVNGFTTDSFVNKLEGVNLVRRQIQRLCPDGARRVLFFEDGRIDSFSAYEEALRAEVTSRLIDDIVRASDAADFNSRLLNDWDLIVYAHQKAGEVSEIYDARLANKLCQGQRAIITENRRDLGKDILRCAGTTAQGDTNWRELAGDGKLFDGVLRLQNPGYSIFTWGIRPISAAAALQGVGRPGTNGAIVAQTLGQGVDENWFVGVLGRGLSKLDPHLQHSVRRTGDDLVASVRMLPSYYRAGGYDSINARVEVIHPLAGLGNIFTERLEKERRVGGEMLGRRAATVTGSNAVVIPSGTNTYVLYDDGTHGDLIPNNQFWSATLAGLGRFDGMYQFRYLLDFTVAGCTTHRELVQSVFVDSKADPAATTSQVVSNIVLPGGRRLTSVRILPRDAFQNRWGPGRIGVIGCDDAMDCKLGQTIQDHSDGSYTVTLETPPGVAGVRLDAFNAPVDVPIACPTCPRLLALRLTPVRIEEFENAVGTVVLSGAAPGAGGGGARVYLSSSNPEVASVPESILILEGANVGSFVISNAHGHGSNIVTITARYGPNQVQNRLTVIPHEEPHVPFEITDIKEQGAFLEIQFMSPYRLERHELDMRDSLAPADAWDHMDSNFDTVRPNTYRTIVPRPAGRQKFFRLRSVFESHRSQRSTSARVWDGSKQPISRTAQVFEHRRQPMLGIPESFPAGLTDVLQVPENFDLASLGVYLDIQHLHVGDLRIELIPPDEKPIVLRARTGTATPDVVGWVGITQGLAAPEPLTRLIGKRASGPWTLRIVDCAAGESGRLNEWALRFTGYERAALVSQK